MYIKKVLRRVLRPADREARVGVVAVRDAEAVDPDLAGV